MKKIIILIFCFLWIASFVSSQEVSIIVPEKYSEVINGERLYFEVGINHPENQERTDLSLFYKIFNLKGELISQSKVLKSVEKEISFLDYIVIPIITKSGLHVIEVSVVEGDSVAKSNFTIVVEANDVKIYFLILLGVILFVGGLLVFSLYNRRK